MAMILEEIPRESVVKKTRIPRHNGSNQFTGGVGSTFPLPSPTKRSPGNRPPLKLLRWTFLLLVCFVPALRRYPESVIGDDAPFMSWEGKAIDVPAVNSDTSARLLAPSVKASNISASPPEEPPEKMPAATPEEPPEKTPGAPAAVQIEPPQKYMSFPMGPKIVRGHSAFPYLSADIWHEIVDYNQTFFVRSWFDGKTSDGWLEWLDKAPWPVTLVMNNQFDEPWPDNRNTFNITHLEHPNLDRLFVLNPGLLHPKVRPLPIGLKWQYKSSALFGENKIHLHEFLGAIASSPLDSKNLFLRKNRTDTVWVRPMKEHWRIRIRYDKYQSEALADDRSKVCDILKQSSPNHTVCANGTVEMKDYFRELMVHRFVASPAGMGIDTHGTWEALLAGCIPIVPRSTLDPMFEDLPVWVVGSWDEVTDNAVRRKAEEMLRRKDEYNWDKVYAAGWAREMGGTKLSSEDRQRAIKTRMMVG